MNLSSHTLRTRLLRRLWWPLLAVLVVSAIYDYTSALTRASRNQDRTLGRIAIALTSRLDVDADDANDDDIGSHLERTVEAMQRADKRDRLSFMVSASSGALIGGDPALAKIADTSGSEQASYADQRFGGQAVRVVTFRHDSSIGPVNVVVAETTHRRQAQARRLLFDTLAPNLLLIALTLLLVRSGVKVAMAPLDELSQEVANRGPKDLRPLPQEGLPRELSPRVSSINRLLERLRDSAQAQQAFLSNAAHQLRTPLAGIQTQLELALRASDAGPQRERLTLVQAALQRMGHTTHQMLALARSDPQAAAVEDFEPVDLQPLLEDAASAWLDQALAAQVDLGFDAQPAPAMGSPWMLHEMLSNLIDNAIRHSPAGGHVTVRCGSVDGGSWLSVEDEGPGIPEQERQKVLGRFYQVSGPQRGGSGLGLAIVSEVAQRHGAELTLDSGDNGSGLKVSVRFPALC